MTAAATATAQSVIYAGFWRRFGAAIVDLILLGIGGYLLLYLIDAAGVPMFESAEYGTEVGDLSASAEFSMELTALGLVVQEVWQWLYLALFESSKLQATPGKLALGLRVTDLRGNRIGFWRSTARNLAKIISAVILFVGFMMAGWTQRKQALHDMIAGCLVVSGRP